jgi:hypothetical protein
MPDAHGRRRLKWVPEWPMLSRARATSDNPSPSVGMQLLVFGCAIALLCLLIEFHSALEF